MMRHCETSERVTKSSAERSHTARPSMFANGFFSLSRNRLDFPAAGRMTANLAIGHLRTEVRDQGSEVRKTGIPDHDGIWILVYPAPRNLFSGSSQRCAE